MLSRISICFLLAFLALGASAKPAAAWTEAGVNSVKVRVVINEYAQALVYYDLLVGVHGGWVEGLEITGLDDGFELMPDIPVSWVSEDGERKYTPTTRIRRGSMLLLSFRRSTSPRRGQYRVRFGYTVDLSETNIRTSPDGELLFSWTLPPWSSGLDDVGITVVTPAGSTEARTASSTTGALADVWQNGHQTSLFWHRAHLPRTMPWTVDVELSKERMQAGLYRPNRAKREAREGPEVVAPEKSPLPWMMGILVCLFCLTRLWLFDRAARRGGCSPKGLLPLTNVWLRSLLIVVLGTAGVLLLASDIILVALVALTSMALITVDRVPAPPGTPLLGAWRAVEKNDLRHAWLLSLRERTLGTNPLDLTALAGWITLPSLAAVVYHLPAWGLDADATRPLLHWQVLLLLLPLAITGTRLHLPLSPVISLCRLADLAGRMRLDLHAPVHPTFKLVVHERDNGVWQDVRLRVLCESAPSGLLRCDVALGQRRDLGGYTSEPNLLLVSRDASRAEAALVRTRPDLLCETAPGGRIARIVPLRDGSAQPILNILSEIRPQTSRGALPPPKPSIPTRTPPPLPYSIEAR